MQILLNLVAPNSLCTALSSFIRTLQVLRGFAPRQSFAAVANHEIAQRVQAGDLVVTGDIPLRADVMERGALAIRGGELYTAENIPERLQMRDFMDGLRASGVQTGGPAALDQAADRKQFADQLDRLPRRAM